MHRWYNRLRSLPRGHQRQLIEYIAITTGLFIIGLVVIRAYVERIGLDEWQARGATGPTMGLLVFAGMLVVWRSRQLALARSLGKWSLQRVAMTVVPHTLYLALVGAVGLPYIYVYLGIAVFWGLLIAFPLNYLLCHVWSLKEAERA